jgi:S-adenosylmethionine:tRNA ribosyltransferase-isomerase
MTAASIPVQRPKDAKLMVVSRCGEIIHERRSRFVDLLHPGDLVIANDAATLPASLSCRHVPTWQPIEVRLAGRTSLAAGEVRHFSAVVFGAGDFHMRTEDRPLPPALAPGDLLALGPLHATVESLLGHPRFVSLQFHGTPGVIWEGLTRHGRPIQYSHMPESLELWDVWSPIAGPPVAFEPPSAGFVLDWSVLASMRARGVRFATITHAAGISSTGDPELDALLPLDEPYNIPQSTAQAINQARVRGARVIAIGTTVVRALEHSAAVNGTVKAGEAVATQRIGASSQLRVVHSILSGTHEPGTSHYDLLRAFADDQTLRRVDLELNSKNYRTHEFGDSVFLERISSGAQLLEQRCAAA